ncbi:hypothetical protein [Pedobacter faecalis]|uniref:hypothetical protein n=1 Tax=Pedobacter faecalis TaxID=3041495 RepID=UPI002551BEBD|nr:hypothetical protein [Pedobacter sp. ELA7]
MDYFPVKISTLPVVNGVRLTAKQFLSHVRRNIDSFTGGEGVFQPYNNFGVNDTQLWNSNNPKGALMALNLSLLDDATVVTSYASDESWTFTTIYDPMYHSHPVSGNRDFGYDLNADGSFMFFTRGVDRLTNADATVLQAISDFFMDEGFGPLQRGDALWETFQNHIVNFVNSHGGSATLVSPVIYRPNWADVKDVIEGKKPIHTLSKDCP